MFEYMIMYCMVVGLGDDTQARCNIIRTGSYMSRPLCKRAAQLRENNLRWLHYEKHGFGEHSPAFVADNFCQEKSI